MKDVVLKELAAKWRRDAKPPEVMDGSPEAASSNALVKGVRVGMEKCASDLLQLMQLLGDEE